MADITLTSPLPGLVYQRSNTGIATIRITGTTSPNTAVKARLVAQSGGKSTGWQTLATSDPTGKFDAGIVGQSGDYLLEVQAAGTTKQITPIGIGEVFALVGHSLVQSGQRPGPAAQDSRVRVPVNTQDSFAGDVVLDRTFGQLTKKIGPFHPDPGPWGALGDKLAKRLNCPVLLYGCGFGGTTVWMLAANLRGQTFEHGFVNSFQRQPYRLLEETMLQYVPLTGIRAVICHHGENDRDQSADQLRDNYKLVIDQVRSRFSMPRLAWILARPRLFDGGSFDNVRNGIEAAIAQSADVFAGPTFDDLQGSAIRYDNLHYTTAGHAQYAASWDNALTTDFFVQCQPQLAPQPLSLPVVTPAGGSLISPTAIWEQLPVLLALALGAFAISLINRRDERGWWALAGATAIGGYYLARRIPKPATTIS